MVDVIVGDHQREVPLEVFEGDEKLLTVRLRRRGADGVLAPLNLSGNTQIELIVKANPTDAAALFTYTKSAGQIAVVDDGSGAGDEYSEITIQFAADDTSARGGQRLRYRLRWTNSTAKKETLAYGSLRIPDV